MIRRARVILNEVKDLLSLFSLVLAVCTILMPSSAHAALDLGFAKEDGGRPGAFLDFAASARSMAMAGAFVGIADDASAAYWNPAGLTQIQRKDLVASYASLYDNTGFSSIDYAQPTMGIGTFGLGIVNLNTAGVPRRDRDGKQDGEFSASETALLLSHGFDLNSRWSFGSSLKVIRQQVDTYSGTGYGLDVAAMFRLVPAVQMGLTVRNMLAPRITLRSESDRFPLNARLGVKWQATRKLLIGTDLDQVTGRSTKLVLGGEWAFNNLLSLRGGLNENEITAGMGIKFKDWGLDYAFAYQDAVAGASDLGASHRLGLHFSFGAKVSEQMADARWQKQGQDVLVQLRKCAAAKEVCSQEDVQRITGVTKQVIRRQGFVRAEDLYMAQGYVSYLTGEYDRSVQSFGEALSLSPQNSEASEALQKARAEMTEESSREIIALELKRIKESYAKSDWKTTVKSCEKVLSFQPDNAEASTYLQDAKNRINEPIDREMKIATLKMERGDYLDALKSLQKVKELDPDNAEANKLSDEAIAALEKQAAAQPSETGGATKPVYEIQKNAEQSRELYSKGLVLYSQGDIKGAAEMWERSVRVDDGNALARSAYNRAQLEMNEKP
jgi:tetratricopeptide (TPR) repeat protein